MFLGCKVDSLSGRNQRKRRYLNSKKSLKIRLKNTVFLITRKVGKNAWRGNLGN
jgi:hypothetical protein